MRILNGILSVLLVLFVAAQVNDPDGPVWMAIYGAGALWCLVAALRPALFASGLVTGLFAVSFAAAVAGMIWFWPQVSNWWDINVWWPEITGETSREGMGMMVLVLCLLAAGSALMRSRRA